MAAETKLLVPGTLGQLAPATVEILTARGYNPVYLGEITPEDIDAGMAHIDNDVCAATISVVGQYMRYFDRYGTDDVAVLAPELCRDCRSVSTPYVLPACFAHDGYEDIEIVPFTSADVAEAAKKTATGVTELLAELDDEGKPCAASAEDGKADRPVIGVCGNMPMITTEEFRHVVVDHLIESGCQVVVPPTQRIADQRDFMTPTLEYFQEQGITTVICILPFGCLGGHVFARGQLRKLQKSFPGIEITILDYDPSASDINLVNRTELVIQSAKDKLAAARG